MSRDQTLPVLTQRSRRVLVKRALQVTGGLVIVGFLGIAAALILIPRCPHDLLGRTEMSEKALRSVAETWRSEHDGGPCPTVEILKHDGAIDSASNVTDFWGHPFEVACEGDEVTVTSAGPDGRFGAADDIRTPTLESTVPGPLRCP